MSAAQATRPGKRRVVLVTGARGFIAGYIIAALRGRGWRVVLGVRDQPRGPDERHCDLSKSADAIDWSALLDGVDAVVNVAGILRESGGQRFDAIHHQGPLALARACVACGIRDVVQISALGSSSDGEFVASKHRFDDALLKLPLRAVVLRPSIVYATGGSYGGTSLLRALAASPVAVPVPGHGHWPVQPVCADDLAALVVEALDSGASGLFEVGGPRPIALADWLLRWRKWLRIRGQRVLMVPEWAVDGVVGLGERLGRGPMGETMWRMLKRGNICAPDAHGRLQATFGVAPRDLDEVLGAAPSQVQDRWHARLYPLAPLLRWSIVVLWLVSGWVGLASPAHRLEDFAAGTPLAALAPVLLARSAGVADVLLAIWLASGWRPQAAIVAMTAMVLGYTLVFGLLAPALWLDPLGGLAKNLVVLPALAVLYVLSDRR
jgi:uncharacterized protein YbjT (DUF2867 family)